MPDQWIQFLLFKLDALGERCQQQTGFFYERRPFGDDAVARPLCKIVPKSLIEIAHLALEKTGQIRDPGIAVRLQRGINMLVFMCQMKGKAIAELPLGFGERLEVRRRGFDNKTQRSGACLQRTMLLTQHLGIDVHLNHPAIATRAVAGKAYREPQRQRLVIQQVNDAKCCDLLRKVTT